MLLLSVMEAALITAGLKASGGFLSSFFMLHYPSVAMFAGVFTSPRLTFAWVSVVAVVYAATSLTVEPGLDFEARDEQFLFIRIAILFAVAGAVNLVTKFERVKRREAVERERDLQQERVDFSQTIHDTIAQSAYMIGLGIESAIELADKSNKEQIAKLQATHALTKSAIWELKYPLDIGLIFEGRELSHVLNSHAATYTSVTSIPAEVVQTGEEPPFPALTRSLLFSIAHNTLTNAFRHAHATKVMIALTFADAGIRMAISDDGIGLPADYAGRGRGFGNMRAQAERMGGRLEVTPGESGRGTTVTCVIPYGAGRGGA